MLLDNTRFKPGFRGSLLRLNLISCYHNSRNLGLTLSCLCWLLCCTSASEKWAGPAEACQDREQSPVICCSWLASETMPSDKSHTCTHTTRWLGLGKHRKHFFIGFKRSPKMAKLINACVKNEVQSCVREALASGGAAVGHVFRRAPFNDDMPKQRQPPAVCNYSYWWLNLWWVCLFADFFFPPRNVRPFLKTSSNMLI